MPRNESRLLVQDMLDAAAEIRVFTDSLSRTTFGSDVKTQRAVAYNFLVLGEAARRIPESVRARFPQVPWSRIVAMRNIVAHEYHRVDVDIIWDAIQTDLPTLVSLLEQAVARIE